MRALPPPARIYFGTIVLAAVGSSAVALALLRPETSDLVAFAVLAPLAAAAQMFIVRTGLNHGFHTALAFVVAAALLLPPGLVALLVLVQHVPEWVKERYPWYIQTFNVANYTLNALAAWLAASLGAGLISGDAEFAVTGAAAGATLVLLNHLLLGGMLRLASGQTLRDSELLSLRSLAIDAVVAGVGIGFAYLWTVNPWLLPVVTAPLVLSHRSFSLLGSLRTSEERFRTMFDDAVLGIALADLDGRIVTANQAFATMLGTAPEELSGRLLAELAHREDGDAVGTAVASVANRDEEHAQLQSRYLTKTGRIVRGELTASLVRDAGTRPRYVLAMIENVTDRWNAEEAVRESQERFRALFENANDMVFTVDAQARFTSINRAGERLTGHPAADLIGTSISELFTPECRDLGMSHLTSKLVGRQAATHEWTMRARNGREVALEVACAPMRRDGQIVGVQAIARDLSERKELEQTLQQAQKMEAIGRLAGGVAHDFNNLMTAITGYSEFALQRLDGGERVHRRDLEEIQNAAERAHRLTTQLLAFSRKQVLEPTRLDVNEVVGELETMLVSLLGADIDVVTRLEPTPGVIEGDRSQLEQVLVNLVVNARDAMPEGGKLTIQTDNVEVNTYSMAEPGVVPSGSYVVLSVSDTGSGMDEATQARLFEPFFTTKEVGKGTGLGLATVYGIVKQSGGYITVDSAPDEGAVFRVYLPRLRVAALPREARPAQGATVAGHETILLVEDDHAVRAVAREILEKSGYRVLAAGDGAEALDVASNTSERIDLLLTDAVMPRLSGPALADRMLDEDPSLKVLFMSGYTEEAIDGNGRVRPGTHFVQKPFTAAVLSQKVRSVLDSNPRALVA